MAATTKPTTQPERKPDPSLAFVDSIEDLPKTTHPGSPPPAFLYDMKPGQAVSAGTLVRAGYYDRTDAAGQALRNSAKRDYLEMVARGQYVRTKTALPTRK